MIGADAQEGASAATLVVQRGGGNQDIKLTSSPA